jgi:hypothetical protein
MTETPFLTETNCSKMIPKSQWHITIEILNYIESSERRMLLGLLWIVCDPQSSLVGNVFPQCNEKRWLDSEGSAVMSELVLLFQDKVSCL